MAYPSPAIAPLQYVLKDLLSLNLEVTNKNPTACLMKWDLKDVFKSRPRQLGRDIGVWKKHIGGEGKGLKTILDQERGKILFTLV